MTYKILLYYIKKQLYLKPSVSFYVYGIQKQDTK